MELSIIILNYKTRGLTKQCIKNIQENTVGLSYEIIVVDNGSNDGCEQMLKENFTDIKFIQTGKNLGFAAGNNYGIKAAQGEYLMIVNPDIVILDNAVEKLLDFMKKNPEVGLAGPRLNNPDGTYQISCRTFQNIKSILYRRTPLGRMKLFKDELARHLMLDFDHAASRPVDWVMGACMIIRRSAVDKVGSLDERFFFYVEDMDWCRRFWANGFKVYYVADAGMIHLYERASALENWNFWSFNKMTRWHIVSWIKYYLKYLGIKKTCQTSMTI